jgi:NSS family neurotransmitter:Na+ symporter
LMVSGLFFAIMVMKHGVEKFRTTMVNSVGSDIVVGRWWNVVIRLVAVQAVVITVWWLWQAVDTENLGATFTLFSQFNVGTVLIQWVIALAAFLGLNRWLAARSGTNG